MLFQTCDLLLLSSFNLVRQPVKLFVLVFLEKFSYQLWRTGPVPLCPAWQPVEILLSAQQKQKWLRHMMSACTAYRISQ